MPTVKEIGKHNVFFNGVSKGKTEHRVSQSFPHKAAQNLSRQKEAAGGFEPGTPVSPDSPKTTFSGTSSNCRAVRGGGGGEGEKIIIRLILG